MGNKSLTTELTEEEVERRREAAIKKMLNTPHTPHKPIGKRKASPKKTTREKPKG